MSSNLIDKMVSVCISKSTIHLVTLVAVSTGVISLASVPKVLAAGCTDSYEAQGENLGSPRATVTVPAQINRSLCGFYDGDYIAFTGEVGKTYRIEILNFEAPNDLELAVYKDDGAGNYTVVTSVAAATELDLKSTFSGRYIVTVNSGRSRLGFYGGGDYVFKITTADGEVPPETTPTLSTLILNPTSVQGGNTVQATVTLVNPAPSCGTSISLFSSNPTAQVPASVNVPGGATSATFTVSTIAVESPTTANITAIAGGTTQEATLTVTPVSATN